MDMKIGLRKFIRRISVGALVASAMWGRLEAMEARPLNVLFIAVDDLRPELGCYGQKHVKSPNIDRLAKRGLVFDKAYCQVAHCGPSRASLLSGVRPGSIEKIHLPEFFKNNGYHTEAMGKVYHGTFAKGIERSNLNHEKSWSVPAFYPGPQYYYSEAGIKEARRVFSKRAKKLNVPVDDWVNHFVQGFATEAPDVADNVPYDGQIAERAVSRMRKIKDDPFFLAVGFTKPHLPFVAPKKYWELYSDSDICLPDNMYAQKDAPGFALLPMFEMGQYTDTRGTAAWDENLMRRLIHGYYACVSYVDAQIGKVLDELDRLGLRENTVIVLWGDHGWKLGEHNAWSKYSNCENDTRVPVIVSAPGMNAAGCRTDAIIELVDLYPTLCDLCGLPRPGFLEGTSAAPLLEDPRLLWKTAAFSQIPRTVRDENAKKTNLVGYAIRTDRYHLTLWIKQKNVKRNALKSAVSPDDIMAVELYDHTKDPEENVNCANNPEYADVVRALKKKLYAGWQAAVPEK